MLGRQLLRLLRTIENGARRGRSVIGRRPVQHGSVAQNVQMDTALSPLV
jgi:hypothetical protein